MAALAELPTVTHVVPNEAWLVLYCEDILEHEVPVVDLHHHLWADDGHHFLAELVVDTASGHNIVATVFLQCGHAYRKSGPDELKPVGETEFVMGIAREVERRKTRTRAVAGIVGAANLALCEKVSDVLRAHRDVAGSRF